MSEETHGVSAKGGVVRRRDAVRNERRLLDATGEIIIREVDPRSVTVAQIAERAGLSPATAYRYYSSVEALMNAYLCEVLTQLRDFSERCPADGRPLFEAVLAEWGRLVEVYGPAMALMRSRRGFLERLHAGDELILTVSATWERPLRGLLASLGLGEGMVEYALFLYNLMFDPHEILDLRASGLESAEALERTTVAYAAALTGWSKREFA